MASQKISALASGNPAQSGDIIPIDRAGSNFSLTAGSIAALAPAGTVTSVGLTINGAGTSGIFGAITGSPVTSSGTINIPLALTSGGVAYASSTTVLSSSALLVANAVMLGGGAGAAPSTKTFLTTDGTTTLTIGIAGGGNGALALAGTTSGSATITAPSIAGTTTNSVVFSNSIQSVATNNPANPTYGFSNATTDGIGTRGSGNVEISIGGNDSLDITATGATVRSGGILGFSSSATNASTSIDTAFSRDSAGVIDVGTGAAASKAGSMNLTNLTATGLVTGAVGSAGNPSFVVRAGIGIWSSGVGQLSLQTASTSSSIGIYAAAVNVALWTFAANSITFSNAVTQSNQVFTHSTTTTASGAGFIFNQNNPYTAAGTANFYNFETRGSFAPTTGTSAYYAFMCDPVINQTGSGAGPVKVLSGYPILTATLGTVSLLALGTSSAVGPTATLTDLYLINQTGQVTKYKGSATAERGHAYNLTSIVATNQTAAISASSLSASVPATGFYRVSVYAKVTIPGTTSVLGGTAGATVTYLDGTDSVSQTVQVPLFNQLGAVVVPATGNTTNTTAALSMGSTILYIGNSSPVTISYGYASTGTTMTYTFEVIFEAL